MPVVSKKVAVKLHKGKVLQPGSSLNPFKLEKLSLKMFKLKAKGRTNKLELIFDVIKSE